jgi:nitrile hydratase accessory protein
MVDKVADNLALTGAGAPPMANGELVFDAPWQGRVFGMARVLCEAGVFSWDEFRQRLISNIAIWEQQHSEQLAVHDERVHDQTVHDKPAYNEYVYYEIFLQSLSMLLANKNLYAEAELTVREAEFLARPHGHDH